MSVLRVFERPREWVSRQLDTLTPGQRWTSALAIGMAAVMLVAGMPTNVRVVAGPPPTFHPGTVVVDQPPPPVVPFTPPAPFAPPAPVPPPGEPPPSPEGPDDFTPPTPPVHGCATDDMLPAPVFASLVEQLAPIQAAYEEATGQPLGVDLVSVAAFIGQCTDALPNAPALVTVTALLADVYEALAAAGVPPIDLPNPPVVPLPDVPAPLEPVVTALAPIVVPACAGIPFFGVPIGVTGALALVPVADGVLPFPSSEILPYFWPARALCGLFLAYAPEPEAASAAPASRSLR